MTKFHQKYFIESSLYEKVNPEKIRQNDNIFKNIHNIENKLTRFQIYIEKELACKYTTPLYKTQYSEILVEYKESFDMNTGIIKTIDTNNTTPFKSRRTLIHTSNNSQKHRENWWKS